jgi:hypothetical protein
MRRVGRQIYGIGALVFLALGLAPAPARASSSGIVGVSGNPATNGGLYCNACHYGGPGPAVAISGPKLVQPGSTHLYVLRIVNGTEVAGGLDVSATAGELAAVDPGTQLIDGEITHVAPRPVDALGNVVFRFRWTAPLTAGKALLYGAANSVDLNGTTSGDRSTKTSMEILVKP